MWHRKCRWLPRSMRSPRRTVRHELTQVCPTAARWAFRLACVSHLDRRTQRHSPLHPGTVAEGPQQTLVSVRSPDFAGPTPFPAARRNLPRSSRNTIWPLPRLRPRRRTDRSHSLIPGPGMAWGKRPVRRIPAPVRSAIIGHQAACSGQLLRSGPDATQRRVPGLARRHREHLRIRHSKVGCGAIR